jgi:hypothetical protein
MDEDQDAREKLAHDAISVLKRNQQLFATISLEVMDGIDSLNRSTKPIPEVQTEGRLEYALKGFHLRARAYLKLVSDLAQQEAFIVLLQTAITDAAWWDYVGARVPVAHRNAAMVPIRELVRVYLKRGYERIAGSSEPPVEVVVPIPKKKLRIFAEPNLELLKNPETLLNREISAEALGVSVRHFDRLVKDRDNNLVAHGAGSRKFFKARDLLRILKKRRHDNKDKSRQE